MKNALILQMQALPYDIEDELPLSQDISWIIIICAFFVLLFCGIFLYFFLRKKRQKNTFSLQQQSVQQLYNLRLYKTSENSFQWTNDAIQVLRDYLEKRFSLPITCRTTEEFFQKDLLKNLPEIDRKKLYNKLRDALQLADLIKFAKMQAKVSQLDSIEKAIEYCIESTPFPVPDTKTPKNQQSGKHSAERDSNKKEKGGQ